MVLLQPVVQVPVGSVQHLLPQHFLDRSRVGVVAICGHPIRADSRHPWCRSEESLGSGHVPRLAEPTVDEVPVAVDRSVQIAPTTATRCGALSRVSRLHTSWGPRCLDDVAGAHR
jgi:hypothetical protein